MADEIKTKKELHAEAVAKVWAGGRITNEHSLFVVEQDRPCSAHHWRTLLCDSETDVCECSKCGKQIVTACNFDEEYD